MGALWLPGLADWLRDGGLTVVEYPGWLTRSRSSGGFDDILAIGLHHDASAIGRSGQRAADAHFRDHPDRPVGNLALDRDGVWWVGAAGASNTQGRGGPMQMSRGKIPLDAGNKFTLAVEAANNGVGEVWPWVQRRSYVAGITAILHGLATNGAYDAHARTYRPIQLAASDAIAHFEWAPTRKIDPAGPPAPWAITADRYQRWDMDAFRADLATALTPPPLEEEMSTAAIWSPEGYANTWLVGAGSVVHLTPELYGHYRRLGVPHITETHPQMLKSVLALSGLTTADLVPR